MIALTLLSCFLCPFNVLFVFVVVSNTPFGVEGASHSFHLGSPKNEPARPRGAVTLTITITSTSTITSTITREIEEELFPIPEGFPN